MSTDSAGTDSGWLVLGGLHHLNGAAPVSADDPVVLVQLARPLHQDFPSNTVVIDWAELGEVVLHGRTGEQRWSARDTGATLFPEMAAGPVLAERTGGGPSPIVPLFYLAVRQTEDGRRMHAHSQIRLDPDTACFIRLTPEPLTLDAPGSGADGEAAGEADGGDAELGWLSELVRLHAGSSLFLNNHQRYYRKCFADQEMEYKYTLAPPVDIWTATTRIYQRLRSGALPGYVMEYRDEWQAWDYVNHLYQVTAPEPERGYVSFIPTTDGRNLVKRKWFAADSFSRTEKHTYGVVPEHGFDAYVRDELGVESTRLPAFRRVRYDVNFESTRTGHVYGIFFDHVSLLDAPEVVLNQCELEYLRSRTVVAPDEAAVLVEIDEIAGWLEEYLREHGLTDERGYYSKMTFLLDSVAARPELATVLAR